jgi:hypothetical protein
MAGQTPKKKKKTKIGAAPSAAPRQALGYLLQETLLTHRLLAAQPGELLSLELLDDLAVHQSGGHHELIQSTSTSSNNPVADRDPKLWKTLSNWIDTVRAGNLDPGHTRFVLYVSTPASGAIVAAFNSASTPGAVQDALAWIMHEGTGFQGHADKFGDVEA